MRFSENRKVAAVILALSVMVSVVGFGGSALVRDQKQVMRVFEDGTDTSTDVRHSMAAYLDRAVDAAKDMALEGERFNVDSALTETVNGLVQTITDAKDTEDVYTAYLQLETAVDKLDNAVYAVAEGDEYTNCKLAYANFKSADDLLSRDGYNELAKQYNREIEGFPAAVVAELRGVGEMSTFGG